jgi:hypothetical protein
MLIQVCASSIFSVADDSVFIQQSRIRSLLSGTEVFLFQTSNSEQFIGQARQNSFG